MTLLNKELKYNFKSFLIWLICVAGMCLGCILLYSGMEESISQMGESFANMGTLSVAFGMDKVSLITMEGYFAIEIALMHGLGGAMYAAILGSSMLAKEEGFHTAEFLMTFPSKRISIISIKYLVMAVYVALFNLVSGVVYYAGIKIAGEDITVKKLVLYILAVSLMQLEIGSICFLISAYQKRSQVGLGIGITVLLFSLDMMCRIVPSIKNLKYVTPFYFANAADIFVSDKLYAPSTIIGSIVLILASVIGTFHYIRKDIAA